MESIDLTVSRLQKGRHLVLEWGPTRIVIYCSINLTNGGESVDDHYNSVDRTKRHFAHYKLHSSLNYASKVKTPLYFILVVVRQ